MDTFIVYSWVCSVTNKQYIGFTGQELSKRISQHLCEAKLNRNNTVFYNALSKYGKEKFLISILGTYATQKEALDAEQYFILTLNTMHPNGYNLTSGGEASYLHTLSSEERSNIAKERSNTMKNNGYWNDDRKEEKIKQLQDGRKKNIAKIKQDASNRMKEKWKLLREITKISIPPKPLCCERGCGKEATYLTKKLLWTCGKYASGCSALHEKRGKAISNSWNSLDKNTQQIQKDKRSSARWTTKGR